METFAQLKSEEKQPYFEVAAAKLGLSQDIIEKDFWVCWTLNKLFSSTSCKNYLLFKGGTSLSKVYKIIENENWKLEIDRDDGDGQTILFHYPSVGISQFNNYINQSVKIEIGARSDHWPSNDNVIMPLIEETSPGTLLDPRVKLKVLSAERTFWEKATILHKFAHFPTDKNVPERQSRHYYDFYKLLSSDISHNAINNLELLARVREHKQLYFRAAWASYSSAKKGALKIIPDQRVLIAMDNDYNKMSEMFYGEKIKWPEIINKLETFEASFNA